MSETRPDSGMVPMNSLYKLAYGLSIAHAPHDVTWPDDVIMVTSWFFFKMLLLRQFLSELDDTLIQCSPIWFVGLFIGWLNMWSSCQYFLNSYAGSVSRWPSIVLPLGAAVLTRNSLTASSIQQCGRSRVQSCRPPSSGFQFCQI